MLSGKGLDPLENADEYEAAWPEALVDIEKQVSDEHDEMVELGGLYVIGSERHESRRIDNQLRGRSGRQGDPGESRFYLSLEDDLMRLFKSDLIAWVLQTLKIPDDIPIENSRVSKSVQQAQEQVESQNFEMRKNVLKYDDVMNRQRHTIYADRRRVLEGADVEQKLRDTVDKVVGQYVVSLTADDFVEDWDFDSIWTQLHTLYPVSLKIEDYDERDDLTVAELVDDFQSDAQSAYDARTKELGEDLMREFERQVLLTVLDRKWREHLYEMDYLREGIGLRAMAQRDPLVEYQREGGDMFNAMMDSFTEEVVGYLYNLEVRVEPTTPQVGVVTKGDGTAVTGESLLASGPDSGGGDDAHEIAPIAEPSLTKRPALKAKGLGKRKPAKGLTYSAPDESGEVAKSGTTDDDPYASVGRNSPCPCGSGKKFKVCHGRNA